MDAPEPTDPPNPWAPPPAGPAQRGPAYGWPAGQPGPAYAQPPYPNAYAPPHAYGQPGAYPQQAVHPAPPWWAQAQATTWGRQPRTGGRRAAILTGYLAAWAVALFAIMVALAAIPYMSIDQGAYPTEAAYNAAGDAKFDEMWPALFGIGMFVAAVGQLVLFAVLARRVGYRWFDTFLQLVPVYGIYFMVMILWRCTDLAQWRTDPYGVPPEAYLPAQRSGEPNVYGDLSR